jgi:hypothetical protein
MGDTLDFRQLSNRQLQAHVRLTAKDSSKVFFTEHAFFRMAIRSVSDLEVMHCLRNGLIERPTQIDKRTGAVKCRMEHFGSSRNLAVVVALDNNDPDLVVVTVMTRTR